MDFNDVIRKRKMIREYDSKQVSDEIIRKLIRSAHRAPMRWSYTGPGVYNNKGSCNQEKTEKSSCRSRICRKGPGVNCGVF